MLKYCYDNGAGVCVGLDYSSAAFEIASKHLKGTTVKLYQLGVDEFSKVEENGFDVVYMRSIIEHIPNTEWVVFLAEGRKKFGKDCGLFASTPATRRGDYLQMHNNYQSYAKLMALFNCYFSAIEIRKIASTFWVRCNNVIREG